MTVTDKAAGVSIRLLTGWESPRVRESYSFDVDVADIQAMQDDIAQHPENWTALRRALNRGMEQRTEDDTP